MYARYPDVHAPRNNVTRAVHSIVGVRLIFYQSLGLTLTSRFRAC